MVAFKRFYVEVTFFVDAASEEDAEQLLQRELRSRGVAFRSVVSNVEEEDEE